MVAAVADYNIINIPDKKIKSESNNINIQLQKSPDILKEIAKLPLRHLMAQLVTCRFLKCL